VDAQKVATVYALLVDEAALFTNTEFLRGEVFTWMLDNSALLQSEESTRSAALALERIADLRREVEGAFNLAIIAVAQEKYNMDALNARRENIRRIIREIEKACEVLRKVNPGNKADIPEGIRKALEGMNLDPEQSA